MLTKLNCSKQVFIVGIMFFVLVEMTPKILWLDKFSSSRFFVLSFFKFLYIFCLVGGGGGYAIPVVLFFFFLSGQGLPSDRSLFPGFVSVICGHYINTHGYPVE